MLDEWKWKLYISGNKIYFIPNAINKENAIKYVCDILGVEEFSSIGDSMLDKEMLKMSKQPYCLKHGELVDNMKYTDYIRQYKNIILERNKILEKNKLQSYNKSEEFYILNSVDEKKLKTSDYKKLETSDCISEENKSKLDDFIISSSEGMTGTEEILEKILEEN
jgi:hypothetical protein